MSTSAERFYAQKDANFKQRVYNILYNDSAPHSEQEALALIDTVDNVFQFLDDIGIKNSSFKLFPQIAIHGLTLFPIFAILV